MLEPISVIYKKKIVCSVNIIKATIKLRAGHSAGHGSFNTYMALPEMFQISANHTGYKAV